MDRLEKFEKSSLTGAIKDFTDILGKELFSEIANTNRKLGRTTKRLENRLKKYKRQKHT